LWWSWNWELSPFSDKLESWTLEATFIYHTWTATAIPDETRRGRNICRPLGTQLMRFDWLLWGELQYSLNKIFNFELMTHMITFAWCFKCREYKEWGKSRMVTTPQHGCWKWPP
jgi:hypothetical protein